MNPKKNSAKIFFVAPQHFFLDKTIFCAILSPSLIKENKNQQFEFRRYE